MHFALPALCLFEKVGMKMSKGDGTTKCGEFVKKGKRREFGDSTEFSYISYQTKKKSQEITHFKKSPQHMQRGKESCHFLDFQGMSAFQKV